MNDNIQTIISTSLILMAS